MTSVDRAGYMDSQMSSIITEQIQKERKIQRNYFEEQEAAGLIIPKPPTPPVPTKTVLETVGLPQHVRTLHADPIQTMNTTISKSMWVSNAGYLVRDGPRMASTTKKDFLYDEEELAYQKSLGFLDKTHNRRRDEFVLYVEASSRMKHLSKALPTKRSKSSLTRQRSGRRVRVHTSSFKTGWTPPETRPRLLSCPRLFLKHISEKGQKVSRSYQVPPRSVSHILLGAPCTFCSIACFHLEEYESAKESFEAGAKLAPDAAQFKTWIRKCQAELDDEADPAASKPVVARLSHSPASMPAPSAPTPPPAPAAAATQPLSHPAPAPCPSQASTSSQAPASGSGTDPAQGSSGAAGQPLARAAVPGFEGKYRHQWYQLQSKVTVDVYAKGLSKEQAEVTFDEQRLLVVLKDASGVEEYRLDMPLYGKIQPGACHYEVLKSKLEITMSKADSTQWASLEKSSRVAAPNYSNPATPPVAGQYPSSYVKAPKDWNKVEAEVKDLENKGELDDGDPLNSFFKKIFSQGDEDQRRAMMKSFVESNGTVLSTNWKEVGAKKIETQPPDGMAVKKWEA